MVGEDQIDFVYENVSSTEEVLVTYQDANHFMTAFLLFTLKGNADTTGSLAAETVSFPGIKYEAAGF